MKIFKFKRLKIVEQIAIVFFFAVLIPMSVSGFIINNVKSSSQCVLSLENRPFLLQIWCLMK